MLCWITVSMLCRQKQDKHDLAVSNPIRYPYLRDWVGSMWNYIQLRDQLIKQKQVITEIEKFSLTQIYNLIVDKKNKIREDYDAASELRPYWINYPPDDRGRQPRGDQIPWIEVGEHAVGDNIVSTLHELGQVRFEGIPAGPDLRFTLRSDELKNLSNGLIDGYWSMTDVKSVGPRDDFDHVVSES